MSKTCLGMGERGRYHIIRIPRRAAQPAMDHTAPFQFVETPEAPFLIRVKSRPFAPQSFCGAGERLSTSRSQTLPIPVLEALADRFRPGQPLRGVALVGVQLR